MDGHSKKVYINPNFNKHSLHESHARQPTGMHVNPAFPKHMQINANMAQKGTIYVNPHFRPPQYVNAPQYVSAPQYFNATQYDNVSQYVNPSQFDNPSHYMNPPQYTNQVALTGRSLNVATCSTSSYSAPKPAIVPSNSNPTNVIPSTSALRMQPPLSKSRYSLVRNEQKKPVNIEIKERHKTTITISKYKSVTVKDLKKCLNIQPEPQALMKIQTSNNNKATNVSLNLNKCKNRYKLVRPRTLPSTEKENYSIASNISKRYKYVRQTSLNKSLENLNNSTMKKYKHLTVSPRSKYVRQSSKNVIGKLKKNNLPCPLFRKYGKCLRKDQGKCEFLHDKKHVSICRKYLKGLCFDGNCLLSHDLSSKKMPTCYFYLKGVCSKENCPYLHVKLNEKTTVCSDFLKGYCEKGSECTKRHVNVCPDLADKVKTAKTCKFPQKNKDLKKNNAPKKNDVKAARAQSKIKDDKTEQVKDSRYYKEDLANDEDICEIKPSRCKLGTLPSFIKL